MPPLVNHKLGMEPRPKRRVMTIDRPAEAGTGRGVSRLLSLAARRADRSLHSLAFRGLEMQKMLADLEDTVYARAITRIAVERPVFITSLPRAGTTLAL